MKILARVELWGIPKLPLSTGALAMLMAWTQQHWIGHRSSSAISTAVILNHYKCMMSTIERSPWAKRCSLIVSTNMPLVVASQEQTSCNEGLNSFDLTKLRPWYMCMVDSTLELQLGQSGDWDGLV